MTIAFTTLQDFTTHTRHLLSVDHHARTQAISRNANLTKPAGALGRLEELAIWYAGWQAQQSLHIEKAHALVFAANHGVVEAHSNVSAYPASVTAQMVQNFQAGGAAINQLCKLHGIDLHVHALDLDTPTQDFTKHPAMTPAGLLEALNTGYTSVDPTAQVILLGEMGIGNTTSAAAVCSALFNWPATRTVGVGTGINQSNLQQKISVVEQGLSLHTSRDPLVILQCLGGREIAAITGAILAARVHRIPVILDGYICCAAAAVLYRMNIAALEHCITGHVSAESAHAHLLAAIEQRPLLDLGMRLGEGSGAAVAFGVLKAALACYTGMATFHDAGVANST